MIGQTDFVNLVQSVGAPVALLVFILWAGAKDWWVYGSRYREVVAERNEWKARALEGTMLAADAMTAAEVVSLKDRRRKA